jgi:hypothetical protein
MRNFYQNHLRDKQSSVWTESFIDSLNLANLILNRSGIRKLSKSTSTFTDSCSTSCQTLESQSDIDSNSTLGGDWEMLSFFSQDYEESAVAEMCIGQSNVTLEAVGEFLEPIDNEDKVSQIYQESTVVELAINTAIHKETNIDENVAEVLADDSDFQDQVTSDYKDRDAIGKQSVNAASDNEYERFLKEGKIRVNCS